MPILIIIVLGAIFAIVLRDRKWPFWAKALAAAFLATATWVAGFYVYDFATSSGNDRDSNWPLLYPILMTFLTALGPALLISFLWRRRLVSQTESRGKIRCDL